MVDSVTIHPDPHYLNLINQLMVIRSSNGFSHLRPGAFLIALQTHQIQHTQPRGWKKRRTNKHGLGLVPSARREKFVTLLCSFLCICGLSQTCIRAKFPQSHQERGITLSRWPIHPLSPQAQAPALFFDCPLLSTAFFCSLPLRPSLPSSSSVLVSNLARTLFVWVSRQNRQRDPLTGTPT